MCKSKNIEAQLVDIDHSIAHYQKQLSIAQVEILKLELKKEKLKDKAFIQSVKSKIAQ